MPQKHEKGFQKILTLLYATWWCHFNITIVPRIDVQLFVFYLSLGLVREYLTWVKTATNPNLVCEKRISILDWNLRYYYPPCKNKGSGVHLSSFSNINSETGGRWKVGSNNFGHMTKIAALPIKGKIPSKSFPLEPKGLWTWTLVCSTGYRNPSHFVQMLIKLVDLDILYCEFKFDS